MLMPISGWDKIPLFPMAHVDSYNSSPFCAGFVEFSPPFFKLFFCQTSFYHQTSLEFVISLPVSYSSCFPAFLNSLIILLTGALALARKCHPRRSY